MTMEKPQFERDIIYYIKRINKLLTIDFDKRVNKHGLTCQQARVLFYINQMYKQGNPVRQVDIENRFNLSKSTVSELIKRMEKNDLITKVKDKSRYVLLPTKHGTSIVDDIHQSHNKVIDKLYEGVNKEKQSELNNILEKMIENMEKEERENV